MEQQKRRVALIDLGTNTFHLLIAELSGNTHNTLLKIKESVKLGEGGISYGSITEAAMQRALTTLTNFREKIDEFQVTEIKALATSAVRNASNGPELIKNIAETTGIEVEIISGDREAELIYYGVRSALEIGEERSLIIDIGGGSVEFIIADGDQIFWKRSFEIGAQRLMDKFFTSDPITEASVQAEEEYVDQELMPLSEAISTFKPVILIGSSGTFDTLCDISSLKKGINRQLESCSEADLTLPDFYEIYDAILHKNRAERLAIPGMLEMRVDMIVVAVILIDYILENFNLHRIRVSSFSLKEGILAEMLNRNNK